MFQAKNKTSDLILDIAWVTIDDTFEEGFFKMCIVENKDWDVPLLNLTAKDKETFFRKLNLALLFFRKYEIVTTFNMQ
jgi:hypothetical protein